MKRNGLAVLLVFVMAVAGCSSGGDVIVSQVTQAQLEQCVRHGVLDMLRLGATLQEIVDVIKGNTDSDITTTRTSGAGDPTPTYDVMANFPYGGSGANDQMLDGTLNFSANPEDGIDVGDEIVANLNLTSQGGPLTGFISVLIRVISDSASELNGIIDITDGTSGCDISFSLDPLTPLTIDGFGFSGPQITVNILGIAMTGPIDFLLVLGDTFVNASMNLLANSQVVTVTGTEDGEPFDPVDVDLFPSDAEVEALLGCAEGLFVISEVLGGLEDVIREVGGEDSPDVTITPVSATSFDFLVTRDGRTIDGTVTLTGLTTASVTWTLDQPGILTGASTVPWIIERPTPDSFTATGAATLDVSTLGCTVTMTVPADAPITFGDSGPPASGRFTLKTAIGDDTLEIDFDATATENEGFTGARINGIPVPPDAVLGD